MYSSVLPDEMVVDDDDEILKCYSVDIIIETENISKERLDDLIESVEMI